MTRHVWISNRYGFDETEFLEILKKNFKVESVHIPTSEQSSVVISFDTIEDALSASKFLSTYEIDGKYFNLKYAEEKVENKKEALSNVSSTYIASNCPCSGLKVVFDFINDEEEKNLIKWIDSQDWVQSAIGRRTQHYGYEFDYDTKHVNTNKQLPIPQILDKIVQKLTQTFKDIDVPDQM